MRTKQTPRCGIVAGISSNDENDKSSQENTQQQVQLPRLTLTNDSDSPEAVQPNDHESAVPGTSSNEEPTDIVDGLNDDEVVSDPDLRSLQPNEQEVGEGDENNRTSNDEEGDKEKGPDNNDGKEAKKKGSSKRKRDNSSETSNAPASKRAKKAGSAGEETTSKYRRPTQEERAPAHRGQRDDSKFTIILTLEDGTEEHFHYDAKKRAAFDWNDPKQIVALNKWRQQKFSRAKLRIAASTVQWTVEEGEILRRIIRRTRKTVTNPKDINWTKVNRKFWSIMQTKKAVQGMEHALSTRSARAKKQADSVQAEAGAAGPQATQSPFVPAENTTNDAAGKKATKSKSNETKEEKEARRAIKKAKREYDNNIADKPASYRKPKKSMKDKYGKSLKGPNDGKKSTGRNPQSHVVKEDRDYVRRKSNAVMRQAGYMYVTKDLLKRRYKPERKNDDAPTDSDVEYSCGEENSESDEDQLELELEDELEDEPQDEPGPRPRYEDDSDDEMDGQRPAGNALGGTLISAC